MSINEFVNRALSEDVGRGDLYARVVQKKPYSAKLVSNSQGILAGVEYVVELCRQNDLAIEFFKHDGERIECKMATVLPSLRVTCSPA